jgi:hypothetical protein
MLMMRKRRIPALALAGVALASIASQTGASKRYRERTTTLATGVSYTVVRDASGPFRIRYVTVEPGTGATLDTVLANDKLPKFETTSSMAQRTGALAAINGDYARSNGRPVFTFAADGYLAQTPLSWGRNFATTWDRSATYIGHPEVTGWAYEANGGTTYPISFVNFSDTPMNPSEVRLFTYQGGGAARAPSGHCLVRLQPLEPPYSMTEAGVEQDFIVERVKCGGRSLKPQGGVILASTLDSQYSFALATMTPGEEVSVGWSMTWPRVLDTVGGNPTLIEAGQIISKNVDGCGAFCARHPRTGVGTTPDGKIIMVTVDGRQPSYSVGMTLREFAELFASLGADYALNLDGGGSTALALNGSLVNRPSDRNEDGDRIERGVSSALVLLPGDDPGEAPQPEPSPSSILPLSPDASWPSGLIARDPASTGGMLAAYARRGVWMPANLQRMLQLFRDSR